MKVILAILSLSLVSCTELVEAIRAELEQGRKSKDERTLEPTPTPVAITTPLPEPILPPVELVPSITSEKRAGNSDCSLVKLGTPNGFLAVCSHTQNAKGRCDKVKVLVPGKFGGPALVGLCAGGNCSPTKFCGWANPDWLQEGKIERSHYCGAGPLPESVKVGNCPPTRLTDRCRKAGRCD